MGKTIILSSSVHTDVLNAAMEIVKVEEISVKTGYDPELVKIAKFDIERQVKEGVA